MATYNMYNPSEKLSEDGKAFSLTFLLDKQVLLDPEYQAMCHDACLKAAHARGLIPIGPSDITETEVGSGKKPPENETLFERLNRQTLEAIGGMVPRDQIQVTVTMTVGSSLDLTLDEPHETTKPSGTVKSLEELLEAEMPNDLSELDGL
jgi:hypothetical protein